jgi:methyl-galactoside transport system substrate-binding protein
MKKSLVLLIVFTMLVASLAGCTSNGGESTDGTSEKLKIGVLIYKYDDTYISTVRQAIEKEAENDTEVELLMNDGQGDQSKQNDQIDILIEKGVDALAVNIVDIGAASSVIDKAKSAGIPVVFFNREPDTEVIKSYDKARFVGTKPEEAGIIQGEMIAEVWNEGKYDRNGDNIMQYVMLKGDADNPEAIARTEYSIKTLNESNIKTEELGLQVANWDNDKANQAMEAWLAKFGDKIEFVIANNDGMASGAISALQNAGYNTGDSDKYIPVFGVDATEEAINLIEKGAMTGTVKQDGEGMGKAVFALAKNAAQGKDFLEGTSYEYDQTGVAVRIPYQPYK